MSLDVLEGDERLVLVGLAYWIVAADGEITSNEEDALADLGGRLAGDDWEAIREETQRRFPDVRSLAPACKQITRPEAREVIYNELIRVAGNDEFHADEVRLLDWLAEIWGFLPEQQPDEPEL